MRNANPFSFLTPIIIAALVEIVVFVVGAILIIGMVKGGIESGWTQDEWIHIAITVVSAIAAIGITSIIAFVANVAGMKRGF